MRESLLAASADREARPRTSPLRLPSLRGGSEATVVSGGVGCFFVAVVLVCAFFVASVSPLEWGVKKNSLNGAVDDVPVSGGLHFMAPWQTYIRFPRTRVTLEWSNSYETRDRLPIQTRTGADPHDPDSGGQQIDISCAVQIIFLPDHLKSTFLRFGSDYAAKERFILLAGNMVSNTAQEFNPPDFWTIRHEIARRMLDKIDATLNTVGAKAVSFEIMKVHFQDSFEQAITQTQVAEQQKVYNEYSQQVQQVEQHINVLNSENQAKIAKIHATALKTSKEMVGNATKFAFINKQTAKATMYAKLKEELEFTDPQFAEYIKIRSLMAQSSSGKVVVNVPPPSVASTPPKFP